MGCGGETPTPAEERSAGIFVRWVPRYLDALPGPWCRGWARRRGVRLEILHFSGMALLQLLRLLLMLLLHLLVLGVVEFLLVFFFLLLLEFLLFLVLLFDQLVLLLLVFCIGFGVSGVYWRGLGDGS